MTAHLALEDLMMLAADLGAGPMCDLGLLDAAAHRPASSPWGREAYPTLEEKAAALRESIVRNHLVVDDNKRLGWLAVVVFFEVNAVWLDVPDDEAYDLVVGVASGQRAFADIVAALRAWLSP